MVSDLIERNFPLNFKKVHCIFGNTGIEFPESLRFAREYGKNHYGDRFHETELSRLKEPELRYDFARQIVAELEAEGALDEILKPDGKLKGQKTELVSACEKYPMFASMHEGIAVLFEEYQEASEELDNIKRYMDMAWHQIRLNNTQLALSQVARIKYAAERLAIEVCQVAAMAEKFIQSERRDKS